MENITFPLTVGMQGKSISDLQIALDELGLPVRGAEASRAYFGSFTYEGVKRFQVQHNLPPTGEVDKVTAETLNEVMRGMVTTIAPVGEVEKPLIRRDAAALVPPTGSPGIPPVHPPLPPGDGPGHPPLPPVGGPGQPGGGGTPPVNGPVQLEGGGDNPPPSISYEVKGTVRDAKGQGIANLKVQVFAKGLRQEQQLAEGQTLADGTYGLSYTPPVVPPPVPPPPPPFPTGIRSLPLATHPAGSIIMRPSPDNQPAIVAEFVTTHLPPVSLNLGSIGQAPGLRLLLASQPHFNLEVKALNQQGQVLLVSNTIFDAGPLEVIDLMEGGATFSGPSTFETTIGALHTSLTDIPLTQVVENQDHQDISFLAKDSGLDSEHIMQLVVAHHIQDITKLPPEIFYAFLRQNLPPNRPGSLLASSDQFKKIDLVVHNMLSGIVSLSPEIQKQALEQAVQNNLLPLSYKGQLDPILQNLQQLRVQNVLEQPYLPGKVSLGTMLQLSTLPATSYAAFAQLYLTHQGSSRAFWDDLQKQQGFTAPQIADLRLTLNLGSMVKNQPPVVTFLKQQFEQKKYSGLRDLAKLDVNAWKDVIKQSGPGAVPANIVGKTDDEKIGVFARQLYDRVERAFPTPSFVAHVASSNTNLVSNKPQVLQFFNDNPAVNLRSTHIDRYLKDNAQSLANIPPDLRTQTVQQVKAMQRVLRLAPSSQAATALLAQNIHSSQQIYFSSQEQFITNMLAQGATRTQARLTYQRAEQSYAITLARVAEMHAQFNAATPGVILAPVPDEQTQQLIKDYPTLQTLFGSLDFCACDQCNSVQSPAAYLVDLLLFLKGRAAKAAGKTARDALFTRRPDLGTLLLNCQNTNTALPYIDLVCELLEDAILPTNSARQTTLSQDELRANPEYVNTAAYEQVLKTAKYPLNMPFHLWLEEVRVYLQHLGVQRYQLMSTLQNRKNQPATPADADVAAEYVGLSSTEQALITTEDIANQPTFWGEADPVKTLSNVAAFLQKTRLDYHQLLELLALHYIQDSADTSGIQRPSDDCDTSQQTITNLSALRMDKIHRFLRLWHKAQWKMWELDKLLRASKVGKGFLDKDALVQLQQFSALQTRLKLPLEKLLAFYDDLNSESRSLPDEISTEDALYQQLFLNNAVLNPPDAAFAVAQVTAGAPAAMLADHAPTVLAALAIQEAELSLLLPKTDGKVSLKNLSLLYRFVALARGMGLSVNDLLLFLNLLNVADPFSSLATTTSVLDNYDTLRASGLTITQLDYLLTYHPDSSAGIRAEVVTGYISNLRTALQKIRDDFFMASDSKENVIARKFALLARLSQPVDVQKALDIIKGRWSGTAAERDTFITDHFVDFTDVNVAKAKLGNLAGGTNVQKEQEVQTRYDYVLQSLYQYVANNTVKQLVSNVLQVQNEQASILLMSLHRDGVASTLLQDLNDDTLLQKVAGTNDYVKEITPANFPAMFETLYLLHKCALLIQRLSIAANDLIWLISHVAIYAGIDPTKLPVRPAQQAVAFSAWQHLLMALQFKGRYPEPEGVSFFGILEALQAAPNKVQTLTALSSLTSWNSTDLQDIDAGLQLQVADYQDIATYQRLSDCFALLKRTGVKASLLLKWARTEPSADDAAQVKQAVKAKYDNERWLEIAAPLQDQLRERKRSALVDYLVAHPSPQQGKNWSDSNDLFSYFLIDVEMSACQLTSRVVQATNTIQLFVQRCLMNLEDAVVADPQTDSAWLQWKWMKAYRLWEANRKVFLYPENWIYPEQRDNKSPFFKDLENELAQNEITDANVEDAFLHYLQQLNDVARLEVSAMYQDAENDMLYVFARTSGTPPTYYYRWLHEGAWSAWEKINLDIQSDQLVPVIYNRKLHLFWPVFSEKPEDQQSIPVAQASNATPPPPKKYWEIQLAWSSYHKGKWSPKLISDLKLIHPWLRPKFAFNFRAMPRGLDLAINVYISSSREFNQGAFDETQNPWHSSEFVFNGNVTAINLIDINGSYNQVHNGYSADGRAIGQETTQQSRLLLPYLSHYHNSDLTNTDNNNNQLYVLKQSNLRLDNGQLLTNAHLPYEVVVPHQDPQFDSTRPFFYQDGQRAYFIVPTILYQQGSVFTPQVPASAYNAQYEVSYQFKEFYHPYTTLFIRELNRLGVPGLFNRQVQVDPGSLPPANGFRFSTDYQPTSLVTANNDQEMVDFSADGAYSLYNWELFFHAPLMIASRLSQNQRFEEAVKWFHYIFDPTNAVNEAAPQRFWITKPFYQANQAATLQQRIDNLLKQVNQRNPIYEQQVKEWRDHPFDPHRIARLRPVAYQKTVVMKYLDTLIAWGDYLFRQESIESINQATQLYVLAAEILGPRPRQVPPLKRVADKDFNDLEVDLDAFGNAMTDAENTVALIGASNGTQNANPETQKLPRLHTFYFGIPVNQQLLGYWDTVANRLFKIRHCENIEGAFRQLPLFAPPIDPALLVKAAAAGMDLGSILNDLNAPLPHYRFQVVVQKAYEFCNEVKMLGQEILAALQNSDAEGLALLRSSQEVKVQTAIQDIRQQQATEAGQLLTALNNSKEVIKARQTYYGNRPFMNAGEIVGTTLASTAIVAHGAAILGDVLAGVMFLIPNFKLGASGFGGTPHVAASTGGVNVGKSAERGTNGAYQLAALFEKMAALSFTMGQYQRRQDEWDFQKDLADKEVTQIDSQIAAFTTRQDIATKEWQNQITIAKNAQDVDDYLHSKFTNQELFDWMVTQLAALYFQSYQLAYDVAKRAERCLRYELGLQDSSYIQFGYWDSLKKGLLAGEKLSYDIRRMEAAYLEQNARELEITKHVSLALTNPLALMQLKENGECLVDLPEMLFDMDYPGHYMRRLKSASLSIPCITGPYTSINCTLTLVANSVRINGLIGNSYVRDLNANDGRFVDQLASVQSIATSHAQDDSGLFELNFRDERYLPFEGAGAISRWHIELPRDANQFNFDSISDVILHLRYTARDAGDPLRSAARQAVTDALPKTGIRLLSTRFEFPNTWYRFLHPGNAADDQELALDLTPDQFPFFAHNKTITITQVELLAQFADATDLVATLDQLPANQTMTLSKDNQFGDLHHATQAVNNLAPGTWKFKLRTAAANNFKSLLADKLDNLFIALHFQVNL